MNFVSTSDYIGISASRLEVLEERLRDDVKSELNEFSGRLVVIQSGCGIWPVFMARFS